MVIQISWKVAILTAKIVSIKKLAINRVNFFLKLKVDLNQICKFVLTQCYEIWNFTVTEFLYIFIKDSRDASKLQKM